MGKMQGRELKTPPQCSGAEGELGRGEKIKEWFLKARGSVVLYARLRKKGIGGKFTGFFRQADSKVTFRAPVSHHQDVCSLGLSTRTC